jgi:hypothetical protein
MKLQILAAAAVLSFAFSGVALADGKITATLKTPVAEKTKYVAAGAVFVCEGDTCIAASAPSRTDSAKGCRAFVKEVGPVVAFGTLEGEDLAKCGVSAS